MTVHFISNKSVQKFVSLSLN